jgi:predicted transcriptional regulator
MSETAEALLTLTADIVTAHVANNSMAVADLPVLIEKVHGALAGLSSGTSALLVTETKAEPAVAIRSSIKPDHIACLCCGKKLTMLKKHLLTDHGLTPDAYRAQWGLPISYPLVAPNYSERRRRLALSFGLGRKAGVKVGKPG